jgi:hypothetical protein
VYNTGFKMSEARDLLKLAFYALDTCVQHREGGMIPCYVKDFDEEKIDVAFEAIKEYLAKPLPDQCKTEESSSIIDQLNKPLRTETINGLTLEYDILGGVNIKIEDFVYVHINYDHRYTHNSVRKELAEKIAELISGKENPLPDHEMTANELFNKLCGELLDGYQIVIECENGSGSVKLLPPDTDAEIDGHMDDATMEEMTLALLEQAKKGVNAP